MTTNNDWPELPEVSVDDPQADVKLALYEAQLEVLKAGINARIAESASDLANYHTCYQEIYKGYIEVAKGVIDRSLKRADFIQKVSAAIATAYTGLLALSFSVEEESPLPITGILPLIFLGLSFLLAAAYVGYLSEPTGLKAEPSDGTTFISAQNAWRRTFIIWTRNAALKRRYLLQTAVVSLAVGLIALPAPYIEFSSFRIWRYIVGGFLLTFLIPAIVSWLQRSSRQKSGSS